MFVFSRNNLLIRFLSKPALTFTDFEETTLTSTKVILFFSPDIIYTFNLFIYLKIWLWVNFFTNGIGSGAYGKACSDSFPENQDKK